MDGLPPTVRLIGIGWYVAACIVFGVIGGVELDKALGLKPVLTMVGLAVGMTLAFWGGYRLLIDTLGGLTSNRKKEK